MTRINLRRMMVAVPTIILVSMLVFALQKLIPGDPVLTMADQLDPSVAGVTDPDKLLTSEVVSSFIDRAQADIGAEFALVGTSDRTMVEL